MNSTAAFLLMVILAALSPSAHSTEGSNAPSLQVKVDPRVELLSLIFRLAGNREYSRARSPLTLRTLTSNSAGFATTPSWAWPDAPDTRRLPRCRHEPGGAFEGHRGVGACCPARSLAGGPRWSVEPESVNNFLAAARHFLRDTGFKKFLEQHQKLYQTTAARMQAMLDKSAHLEWYQSYFGDDRAPASRRCRVS